MARLLRTVGIFGGFVVVVAAAFYPIYFRPLLLPEEYSESLGGAGSRPAVGGERDCVLAGSAGCARAGSVLGAAAG